MAAAIEVKTSALIDRGIRLESRTHTSIVVRPKPSETASEVKSGLIRFVGLVPKSWRAPDTDHFLTSLRSVSAQHLVTILQFSVVQACGVSKISECWAEKIVERLINAAQNSLVARA